MVGLFDFIFVRKPFLGVRPSKNQILKFLDYTPILMLQACLIRYKFFK